MTRIVALVLACWASVAVAAPSGPVCGVRVGGKGGPAIHIGNAPYTPLIFSGTNGLNRDDVLLKELREAAGAGLPLFGFDVPLQWGATEEQGAKIVDTFCEAHPEGYFYVRIPLDASEKWLDEHPDECVMRRNGPGLERVPCASPGSTVWREATAQLLADRVRQIATGPHGAHFIGVEFEYQAAQNSSTDYSPANLAAFRVWLRRAYKSNGALREAWNDPGVSFDSAALPTAEQCDAVGWGPFRDPRANRAAMDVQRFQRELAADTIAYFADTVKEATARRALVGARCDSLALKRLLACKDVDFVHAPYSDFEREAGQPGHLDGPVDSFALQGKLFLLEDDTCMIADGLQPGITKSPFAIANRLAVVCRTFGCALTHRSGISYVDALSDGRWQDSQFWQATPLFRRLEAEMRSAPPFQPQVAFVVNEDASDVIRVTTWPALWQTISSWRAELDRIGTPVGYYLQSDLANLPDSVRVIILADAFVIDKTERRAIEKRLDQGATVVWTYAPDVVGPDGVDYHRIGGIAGMAVELGAGDTSITISSALTNEEFTIDATNWTPRFVVTGKEVDVVARYKGTNEVSAAACPMRNGVSVYTATPRLPVGLIRTICARAGVHLYRDTPGMTGVAGHYLIVHTEDEGKLTLKWPYPCRTVERVVPPSRSAVTVDDEHRWTDTLPARTTAIYACYAD